MMQTVSLNEAYPITYVTYGNVDFGTVKSLEMRYDLGRTGNVKLTAAYTLQFAKDRVQGRTQGRILRARVNQIFGTSSL